MLKKHIFIIGLFVYLIIIFVSEAFYREKLYQISVEYIEKINQSGFLKYFFYFWSYIYLYGMLAIGVVLALFLYPINIFYCNVTIAICLIFTMCLLKSIYRSPRPYWDIYLNKLLMEEDVNEPTECDGEFGNPSGHSLLSTYVLNLWYLFINSEYFNNYKKINTKIIVKYITLIISIVCIFCTTYSRIHRQVHSINQIIHGTLIGLSINFIFCYIIDNKNITSIDFFNYIYIFRFILIPIILILYIVSVVLGFLLHNDDEDLYEPVLKKYCDYIDVQIFGKNTAFHSSLLLVVLGGYLGFLFLRSKIKKNYPQDENSFYNWNKSSCSRIIKIFLFSVIFPGLFYLAVTLISYDYFVTKFIIAIIFYLFFGFFCFGFLFYYGCVFFKEFKKVESSNNIHFNNNIINDIV